MTATVQVDAKVDALNERLFNHGSGVVPSLTERIESVEKAADDETWWDRKKDFVFISMLPLMAVVHAAARKLGLDI